jgi:ribosomal protein S18 acetylase RimI-like enzyme
MSDQVSLLEIIQLNIPTYFAQEEKDELKYYLENEMEDYFVVEKGNKVVAGGGINYPLNQKFATISWDLIHPDFQGIRIGSELIKFRINHIQNKGFNKIRVRTSQQAFGFYEKHNFVLQEVIPDYWAKGYDLYDMFLVIVD